jgi:hypothetical protein
MPDVELPDGTIIEGVPEGPTKSELQRRLGKFELSPQPTAEGTFAKAAGGRVVNAALGIPDMLLRTFTPPSAAAMYPEGEILPIPRLDAVSDEVEQQFPKANFAGELAGDAATLVGLRQGGRAALEMPKSTIPPSRQVGPYLPLGVKRALDDFARKVVSTNIPRGVGRAVETGFEGATLAALHSDDPVESGAYAAGMQAGASVMQTLAKPFFTGKGAGVLVSSFIAFEVIKSLVPGGKSDDILDSASSAIDKAIPVFALGVASSMAAKRFNPNKSIAQNLPKLADAIESIPRGMVLSTINHILEDKSGNTGRVVEQFAKNPEQFGPGAMVRLERAIENGTLNTEVESLMQVPEFARQVLRNQQGEEAVRNAQVPRL